MLIHRGNRYSQAVEDFIDDGGLTAEQGQDLIDLAQTAIDFLNG